MSQPFETLQPDIRSEKYVPLQRKIISRIGVQLHLKYPQRLKVL